MKKEKRNVDLLVLSDVHLGTFGCHAKELLRYLKSIRPKTVVLNGDFIDIWQFSKRYWPPSHMKVVRHVLGWVSKGVRVHYITGNHDELLRRFRGFSLGSFSIANKLLLRLPQGEAAWIFHGDVFDVTMRYSKWLAKLGATGYDLLILLNRMVNFVSVRLLKRGPVSLSKKIKHSVKKALTYINDFEETAAGIGIANGYAYVVCGHLHHPQHRVVENGSGSITYLNSGDWVEHLTSLEYHEGAWQVYAYHDTDWEAESGEEPEDPTDAELFRQLIREFNGLRPV
ncbi:MAG TPA: UDP-2,3-diacylglucosamine diphosphatase [Chitinophagaceae bacterium]|jgi:UDP-2,3-diacylglucosamine pyrophosphatase LpxH|nr:UDP-2,3-diacylglucosamine diphosphatase [Chitinophagaceae bacterium]